MLQEIKQSQKYVAATGVLLVALSTVVGLVGHFLGA